MLTTEQLAMRRTGIGASESAAILGLSPYARPIDVWRRKVEPPGDESSHHTERGTFLERGIAQWWAHRHGGLHLEPGETLRHASSPHVLATPDFIVPAMEAALEVKAPGPRQWHRWEPDDAPIEYLVQVQHQLAVLGERVRRGVLVGFVLGDLAEVPVEADAETQGLILEACERFWRDHVETKRPPEPDGSESYSRHLKRRYEAPRGPVRVAEPGDLILAREYEQARRRRELAEAEEKVLRQRLEALIGEAEGLEGPGVRIRWSAVKGRPMLDVEALLTEFGVSDEARERHTKRTPYRRFTARFED